MAQVATLAPMPLATNMCVVAFADIPEAVRLGSVGIVLSDHHYWGGLRASSHSRRCATHSAGVCRCTRTPISGSAWRPWCSWPPRRKLRYACDTHIPWARDDVVRNPLSIVDGAIRVSDAPGLGVELDDDALARLHRQ